MSSTLSPAYTKLLKELEQHERMLAKYRKIFQADGKITKEEQQKLDKIQAAIDGVIKALTADSEIIAVSDPPPDVPSDIDGPIQYEGIPLDKLSNERDKNVARRNAGNIRQGIRSLEGWSQKLSDSTNKQTQKETRYNAVVGHTENVNDAFAKDRDRGAFKKLSKAVGPAFSDTLGGYEQATSDANMAYIDLTVQAYRIAAAKAMVEQAETLVEAYAKEKERDAEGKKLAELKTHLDDLRGGVNFVIDAAKDPKAKAKDVAAKVGLRIREAFVDEIVDGLLGGQKLKKEISEIEARITALNNRLDQLKLTGLNAGVNQAANTLNAEFQLTMKAQEALTKARRAQGQAVDKLALMEKNNPGTTTVFGQLQQYYGNVQNESADMMQSSKNYEKTLRDSDAALKHTADLRQSVKTDRAAMNHLYPVGGGVDLEDEKQRAQTEAIVAYADKVDRWHKSQKIDTQLQEQRQFQDSLRHGDQYQYIGKLVDAIQADGLGDVQRDKPKGRTAQRSQPTRR